MDKVFENVYNLYLEEFNDLEKGLPYNKERLMYIRSVISMELFLAHTTLHELDVAKIIEVYEYI